MRIMKLIFIMFILIGCASRDDLDIETSATTGSNHKIDNRSELITTLNGINIMYPHSEGLDWEYVNDEQPNDEIDLAIRLWLEMNREAIGMNVVTVNVHRIYRMNNYLLLSGGFSPGFRGGDISWVVDLSKNEYIGHFFDKDSR